MKKGGWKRPIILWVLFNAILWTDGRIRIRLGPFFFYLVGVAQLSFTGRGMGNPIAYKAYNGKGKACQLCASHIPENGKHSNMKIDNNRRSWNVIQ